MNHHSRHLLRFPCQLFSLMLLLFLAGCGGGGNGGDRPTPNDDPPATAQEAWTVTATAGPGGSISPASTTVDEGTTTSFTVTPDTGYTIASVTGCDGNLSGDTYTTGPITADCAVTAGFALKRYTVTTTTGTGGTISPTSTIVDHGDSTSLTVTPDTGYAVASVTGCNGSLSGNTYTTGPVTADCTVTAGFTNVSYTISANATALPGSAPPVVGGQVQGAGGYADGAAVTLVAVPAPGFAFLGWEENGATVAVTPSYHFTASSDRSLTAHFAARHPFVDRMLERAPTLTVAVADFNGDGHADDLLADRIWLNNGRAGFRARSQDASQRFSYPSSWRATLPLDADGDGDDDVLTSGANGVVLFRNDGTGLMLPVPGAFGTTPPLADSGIPAAGDLDGDGDVDLAMATGSGTADVWFNDGQGGFNPGQDLGELSDSGDMAEFALADLDGDGDLDLVLAHGGTLSVHIWFNNGRGGFTSTQAPALDEMTRVATGDLDGDGHIDLVFGHANGTEIWFNDGQGGFSAATSGKPTTAGEGGIAAGDVDGDGDLDLVVGDKVSTQNNQVWLNDGSGAFSPGQALEADVTQSVTLADLDRDGDLDIATANGCLGCIPNRLNRIWINDGQGNFREPVVSLTSSYPRYSLAAADIDGDGDPDLVEPNGVWRNDGEGIFTRTQDIRTSTAILRIAAHVALGDLDGDGDPDLVVSNTDDSNNTTVWFNDNGSFTQDTSQTLTPSDNLGTVLLADMDGDGDLDLLIFTGTAGGTTGDLVTWLNDGGTFTEKGTLTGVADYGRNLMAAEAVDIDGDGDLDVNHWSVTGMGVLLNDGSGTFTNQSLDFSIPGSRARAISLRAADFDGDGDSDLAVGYNRGADSRIWLNDGTGAFTDSGQTLGGGGVYNFAATDLDGDGDLDLVATVGGTNPYHNWINDGDGNFTYAGEIRHIGNAYTIVHNIVSADFDGNGSPDLAMARSGVIYVNYNAITP